jgi:type IV pilus assembly protein PilC
MPFTRNSRPSSDTGDIPQPRQSLEDAYPQAGLDVPVAAPTAPSATNKFFAKKVKGKDLMTFSRQLAAFIRAGIPILDALDMLIDDSSNATLKLALTEMSRGLSSGESLSETLDRHPKVFPTGYRAMLRSAELTGNLDTVLDRLAHYLERDYEAQSKIRAALVYPIVVAVMAVGVITLLVVFVLPKFEIFFQSFKKELPLPTRMLLNSATFLGQWYWVLLIAVAAAVVAGFFALRNEKFRGHFDRWLLQVPLVGPTIRFAMVERFARVLGSMLQAG